jgi:hypothetical protein
LPSKILLDCYNQEKEAVIFNLFIYVDGKYENQNDTNLNQILLEISEIQTQCSGINEVRRVFPIELAVRRETFGLAATSSLLQNPFA